MLTRTAGRYARPAPRLPCCAPSGALRCRTPLDRRSIGVQYQDASNIARWRSGGVNRRCRGNAWFIPYDTIKFRDRDRPHPATFPPRLAEYCMRLHGVDRIRRAMDPFLGLGSSAVAAARLDVDFVGVEIDGHYLATGVQRVNDELNERGLFESAKAIGIGCDRGRQDFDGDVTPKARVMGSVHLAHPAGSDGAGDFVSA